VAHTDEELKHQTVAELREIAAGIKHEAVQGYTRLNKEHLFVALRKALGIDTQAHRDAKGINKAELKTRLEELQRRREEALAARDREKLKAVPRDRHRLNHKICQATV
jgi:hypothetical protein